MSTILQQEVVLQCSILAFNAVVRVDFDMKRHTVECMHPSLPIASTTTCIQHSDK